MKHKPRATPQLFFFSQCLSFWNNTTKDKQGRIIEKGNFHTSHYLKVREALLNGI